MTSGSMLVDEIDMAKYGGVGPDTIRSVFLRETTTSFPSNRAYLDLPILEK